MALFSVIYDMPILLTVEFTVVGVLTDPTTITFRVKRPNEAATEEDYIYGTDGQVTKLAVGRYQFRYDPTEAGLHWARVEGTSACEADFEAPFQVQPSVFTAAA